MCEHGGRGCFDANNRKLADTLGISGPKVSAHLRALERAGLLLIVGSGNGEKRVITPSEELRQTYSTASAQTLTELMRVRYANYRALTAPTLIESVIDPYRIDKGTLTDSVTNPYRFDKHNSIEEEKEKKLIELTTQCAAADAALCEAQKKIEVLESRLLKATEIFQADQTALAAAQKKIEALRQVKQPAKAKGRKLGAEIAGPLATLVNPGGLAETVQQMKKPLIQAEADALVSQYGTTAVVGILSEMANYSKLFNNISTNLTARKWLDKRTTPPTHANAPFGHSQGATGSRYNTSAKGTFGGFAQRSGSPATQPLGGADPNKFPG